MDSLPISVVIITYNEEHRLLNCLASLPEGCEIIIVDSGSTDQTTATAKKFGARFEHRPFLNFSDQKNAAIDLATRSWVLSIDADEVMSPHLNRSLQELFKNQKNQATAYRLDRRLVYMGRPLRFGKTSDSPVRLFRRGKARFSGAVHESLQVQGGTVEDLTGVLWHYSYDDLEAYFERFNRYTSLIAKQHYTNGRPMPFGLKHVLRPWFEFANRYFFRLGFLDGYPGYTYAVCSSLYSYIKYAKLKELYTEQRIGNSAVKDQ